MKTSTSIPIMECVPNFSHGRDDELLSSIRHAITGISGQKLLHVDSNIAANRSVFTFAGRPESVVEAAYRAIREAARRIDMRAHTGAHPRLGATDVCPLVPLAGCKITDAVYWADLLAKRVGRSLNIPVYLYENSAKRRYRVSLPQIRKGGYEGLPQKMQNSEWLPDYGPNFFREHEDAILKTGATIIGARNLLIAFNISLDTRDVGVAKEIARRIRSSGYRKQIDAQQSVRHKGLLPHLRAIGWYIDDFRCAQVSCNLINPKVTSPLIVWETVRRLAQELGCQPVGCEVIGLIPERYVLEAGEKYAALHGWNDSYHDKKNLLAAGIEYLHLDAVKPFIPEEKILEYALMAAGLVRDSFQI